MRRERIGDKGSDPGECCWIHGLLSEGLTPCPQFIHTFCDRAYSFYLPAITSGARSVNSSFVSDGILSFSPFVSTCTAVAPPPPTRAPIAAPLPPPAIAPITAPMPAPAAARFAV